MNEPSATRLRSLDVFRGATVVLTILVNNPGNCGALAMWLDRRRVCIRV